MHTAQYGNRRGNHGFEAGDGKRIQDLKAENERRAEAIHQMIREMKEAQAQEELDANSPNVIGGGGNG